MKSAKEMFKELGYEKAEKSESVVLYTNGYGDTISFKETKHVVITPIQGCRTIIMTCLLENAIHKQCEELGWLEEENVETNLDHYSKDIAELFMGDLAVIDGKPKRCIDTVCNKRCDFYMSCDDEIHDDRVAEWFKEPYKKPTYKLTQCEYDMLDTIFEKEARFSTVYLIGELKKKGYFENIKCDSKVLVKDILANCEVIE